MEKRNVILLRVFIIVIAILIIVVIVMILAEKKEFRRAPYKCRFPFKVLLLGINIDSSSMAMQVWNKTLQNTTLRDELLRMCPDVSKEKFSYRFIDNYTVRIQHCEDFFITKQGEIFRQPICE